MILVFWFSGLPPGDSPAPPTEIITAYKVVNDKFKNRLTGIRNQWKDIYYYNPLELDAIDKSYAEQLADQKQEKIKAFVDGYDENNPNSTETFNNLFNADDLKGIIQEWRHNKWQTWLIVIK